MKKVLTALLAVFVLSLAVTAAEPICIYDSADLLTEAAEYTYTDHARTAYTESGLLCVVVTGEYISVEQLTAALPTYAYDAADMALLSLDMGTRNYDLYQYNAVDGESAFRISAAEADGILDGIFEDIANGDYLAAFEAFADLSVAAYQNGSGFLPGSGGEDYYYQDYGDASVQNFWQSFGTYILIGLAVGGIVTLCVFLSYRKKVHGDTYPLQEFSKLHLTASQDNFTGTTRAVIAVKQDSDNHSSGGGFHGGGSFHSGGGGAHMGGRSF